MPDYTELEYSRNTADTSSLADKLLSIYNIEDIIAFTGREEAEVLEYLIRTDFIEVPEEFIPI